MRALEYRRILGNADGNTPPLSIDATLASALARLNANFCKSRSCYVATFCLLCGSTASRTGRAVVAGGAGASGRKVEDHPRRAEFRYLEMLEGPHGHRSRLQKVIARPMRCFSKAQ
jgi:hypothetical protein